MADRSTHAPITPSASAFLLERASPKLGSTMRDVLPPRSSLRSGGGRRSSPAMDAMHAALSRSDDAAAGFKRVRRATASRRWRLLHVSRRVNQIGATCGRRPRVVARAGGEIACTATHAICAVSSRDQYVALPRRCFLAWPTGIVATPSLRTVSSESRGHCRATRADTCQPRPLAGTASEPSNRGFIDESLSRSDGSSGTGPHATTNHRTPMRTPPIGALSMQRLPTPNRPRSLLSPGSMCTVPPWSTVRMASRMLLEVSGARGIKLACHPS